MAARQTVAGLLQIYLRKALINMKKTGVFLADGLEEIEGLTVVDILRRAGVEVVTISVSGKKEVTGAHQITVLADELFEQADFAKLDGVVLPGGMPGTTNLMNHEGVNRILEQFAAEGKLIAAICAAPSVLGQAGLLAGRRAACYPGFEEKLTGAVVSAEPVVQDENIITSRGMGTAISFALSLTAYFLGQEKADEIGTSILWQ